MRPTSPWVFERLYGLPQVTRPSVIGVSVFFWALVFWTLFWFYRAACGKYERFLVASFALGFAFSVIRHFVSPQIAVNVQFLATAAALVSFVAALTLLFTLPAKTAPTP